MEIKQEGDVQNMCHDNEGGNRQSRLYLESETPSWAGLWTLSYMPSIYGNDIPTRKPDPWDGRSSVLIALKLGGRERAPDTLLSPKLRGSVSLVPGTLSVPLL